MTGIEKIRSAVLASAETEASRILQTAKKHAEDIIKAGKEAAVREAEHDYRMRTRAIEEEYARKIIQLRGAANKEILERKNKQIRAVFQAAREKILKWPKEKYAEVMARLLEKTTQGVQGVVRVHAEDKDLFSSMVRQINSSRGAQEQLALDESAFLSEKGGFVFIASDYEVDARLDTILADLERQLTPELAVKLFEE